ncbi:LytR/AlgR family response regulator transcription factor [Roseivirga sp.]|uniref:LytR/AlgR family response regulator transcription factor n=1 Tax=Roseivirga sp. TaxID=1964215 RepID=UPI003B8BD7A5
MADKKAIVNCLVVDDEKVARDIICNHLAQIASIKLAGSCSSALEAFHVIHEQSIDLVFLDINMPELSGLSFAKSLNKDIKVVFTTAYREYALEGFELHALDYLMKPISFERIFKAVNRYFEIFIQPKEIQVPEKAPEIRKSFFVKVERKMVKIVINEVSHIESLKDYLKIHTSDGTIVTRETISNIEARLPKSNFLRIHRSYIVAINHIISYTQEYVELDGTTLPISRSYKAELNKRLKG